MLGASRRPWQAVLLAVVLASAGLAGCIGGEDGSEDVEADQDEPDDVGNQTDETASNATEEREEVVFETRETTFEGSGTGVGVSATGSNFWIISQGYRQDFSAPDTFQEGTLTFEWSGTESEGGLLVWVQDDEGETVHIFEAASSPFEIELDEDDERVQGAAEVVVLPTQGMPATAHVQIEWSGAFAFTVPVQAG